jgi:RimJ/RimL family protein N-acetyltransferase
MTAFDESGVVGHFILRFTDEARIILRLGFVIIDDTKRGNCYGREMIELAVKFGFDNLMAEMITLGVFENNESARRCYRAAGFRNAGSAPAETFLIMGKEWNCFEMEMDRYSGIMPVVGIHENGSVIDGINIQPPYYHLYDLLVYYKEKRGYEYSLETVYLNNTEENRAYIQTLLTKLTVWMLSKAILSIKVRAYH